MNFQKHLLWATCITVLINAAAMFSPVINSGDAITYASLSQHIVLSHDWARLVLDGHDWLDKPHLPFWITALFFKLGGISAFTYILPGFIFHLIGAYYTYRVARLLYDKQTAALAVLIYVSIFNLMDASIEVKAETYLVGQIMPACYYWLRYDATIPRQISVVGCVVYRHGHHDQGYFYAVHDFQWPGLFMAVPKAMDKAIQYQMAGSIDFVFAVCCAGTGRTVFAVQPTRRKHRDGAPGFQLQILLLG